MVFYSITHNGKLLQLKGKRRGYAGFGTKREAESMLRAYRRQYKNVKGLRIVKFK